MFKPNHQTEDYLLEYQIENGISFHEEVTKKARELSVMDTLRNITEIREHFKGTEFNNVSLNGNEITVQHKTTKLQVVYKWRVDGIYFVGII